MIRGASHAATRCGERRDCLARRVVSLKQASDNRKCSAAIKSALEFLVAKSTDIRIVSAQSTTERIDYRTPMKFGGRVVTDVLLLHVAVEVETAAGRRAEGFGSMPVGNAW